MVQIIIAVAIVAIAVLIALRHIIRMFARIAKRESACSCCSNKSCNCPDRKECK